MCEFQGENSMYINMLSRDYLCSGHDNSNTNGIYCLLYCLLYTVSIYLCMLQCECNNVLCLYLVIAQ